MKKLWLLNAVALAAALTLTAPAQAEDEQIPSPAREVADAAGLSAWANAKRVKFTWRHEGRKLARSYDWDVPGRRVTVTMGGSSKVVDLSKPDLDDASYNAFVNDSYWAFFPLFLVRDRHVKVRAAGPDEFDLVEGAARALLIEYGDVGKTPGDAYVLHLDAEGKDVGWSYMRGGVRDEPTLVTTREAHVTAGGVRVATQFKTRGGELIIAIEGLVIE